MKVLPPGWVLLPGRRETEPTGGGLAQGWVLHPGRPRLLGRDGLGLYGPNARTSRVRPLGITINSQFLEVEALPPNWVLLPARRSVGPWHRRACRHPGIRRQGLAFGKLNLNLSAPKEAAARLMRTLIMSGIVWEYLTHQLPA